MRDKIHDSMRVIAVRRKITARRTGVNIKHFIENGNL